MSNSFRPTGFTDISISDIELENITISTGANSYYTSSGTTLTTTPVTSSSTPYQYTFDTSTFSVGATVGGVNTFTTTGLSASQISALNGTSSFDWKIKENVPFEDGFPAWDDFRKMCDEYPGLEKTFEHLKVFYRLCKDEWETKKRNDKL